MTNTDQIKTDMPVIGSDGRSVGSVDSVEGGRIKLNRKDPQAGGVHHYIPSDWVESVAGNEVRLNKISGDVKAEWEEGPEDSSARAGNA